MWPLGRTDLELFADQVIISVDALCAIYPAWQPWTLFLTNERSADGTDLPAAISRDIVKAELIKNVITEEGVVRLDLGTSISLRSGAWTSPAKHWMQFRVVGCVTSVYGGPNVFTVKFPDLEASKHGFTSETKITNLAVTLRRIWNCDWVSARSYNTLPQSLEISPLSPQFGWVNCLSRNRFSLTGIPRTFRLLEGLTDCFLIVYSDGIPDWNNRHDLAAFEQLISENIQQLNT
jgi:hypothetical protein